MPDRLIPGRVQGYSKRRDGFMNTPYLSMTQPYAAGSLASSVDDLAVWDAALYTEKLLKQESLGRAWTSFKLNNGKLTHYGYGWNEGSWEGHKLIAHNGDINGFSTSGLRLPEDRVYVAVLSNQNSPEQRLPDLTLKVAGLAIGKPYKEPTSIRLPASALARYAGAYKLEGGSQATVAAEGGKLTLTLEREAELLPLSDTEFLVKGSTNRIIFVSDATRAVTGFLWHPVYGYEVEAVKTPKP
jgi:CubicO group peptidase (beta-lactamase class C family)